MNAARRLFFAISVVPFSLNSTISLAIVERHDRKDSEYLEYAQEKAFESVGLVKLVFNKENKFVESYCTGTLIDRRTVLTSADCISFVLKNKGFGFHARSIFYLGNDVLNSAWVTRSIKSAMAFPAYEPMMPNNAAQNLALLYLDAPVLEVEPANILRAKIVDPREKRVSFVGFGFAGNPIDGIQEHLDYRKRAAKQVVTDYRRTYLVSQFQKDSKLLNGMPTHGDQGGPVFWQDGKGEWKLVGLNTYRIAEPTKGAEKIDVTQVPYGSTANALAIAPYLKWLDEHRGEKFASWQPSDNSGEWSFNPYWSTGFAPFNLAEAGAFWKVNLKKPGTLLLDRGIDLDELNIDHEKLKVVAPPGLSVEMTEAEYEEKIDTLVDKKGDLKGAWQFKEQFAKRIDEKHMLKKVPLGAWILNLKQGQLIVDGELKVDQFNIYKGTLAGRGQVVQGVLPVHNYTGTISPYYNERGDVLKFSGDLIQHEKTDQKAGSVLKIKVGKAPGKGKHRIGAGMLRVEGRLTLGGTLVIDANEKELKAGEEVDIAYAVNGIRGDFQEIVGLKKFTASVSRDDSTVRVRFDRMPVIDLTKIAADSFGEISAGNMAEINTDLQMRQLRLNGGAMQVTKNALLNTESLDFTRGMLELGEAKGYVKLAVAGNYQQSSTAPDASPEKTATLALKLGKILREKHKMVRLKDKETGVETERKMIETYFELLNDQLEIKGVAKLGGKLLLTASEQRIKVGERFTLIRADKIEGRFDSVEGLPGVLRAKMEYTEKTVELVIEAKRYQDIPEIRHPKAREIAQYLDELRPKGNDNVKLVCSVIDRLPVDQIENFLLTVIHQKTYLKEMRERETARKQVAAQQE